MALQTRIRGGRALWTSLFVGAARQITINTTTNDVHVHDGVTPGGAESKGLIARAVDRAGLIVEDIPNAGIDREPRKITVLRSEYDITDFGAGAGNGRAQLSKAMALRDYQPAFKAAVESGERVKFPKDQYPLRSKSDSSGGVVSALSGAPVDLDFARGAEIVAGEQLAEYLRAIGGSLSSMLQVLPPDIASVKAYSFRMRGATWSGQALSDEIERINAAAIAAGQPAPHARSYSMGFIDLYRLRNPVVKDCRFLGGKLPQVAGNLLGYGWIDTAVNDHGCFAQHYDNCIVDGLFDLAFYLSGTMYRTVATDPYTSVSGTSRLIWTDTRAGKVAHDMRVGDYVNVPVSFVLGGITVAAGAYQITAVADEFSLEFNALANFTSSATGGGAATLWFDKAQWSGMMDGKGGRISNCVITNCANAVSAKRNYDDLTVEGTRVSRVGNGMRCADVGGPSFGSTLKVRNCTLEYVTGFPIVLSGRNCQAVNNIVRQYGMALDGSAYTPHASDNAMAGIKLVNCESALVEGNRIGQFRTHLGKNTSAAADMYIHGVFATSDDAGYLNAFQNNVIRRNVIQNVDRALREGARHDWNDFIDNREVNCRIASAKTGANTRLGRSSVV